MKKTKFNLSKGLGGRLIGAVGGGAASALYDKYVNPLLPSSMEGYSDYVKIGIGVVLPTLVKNNQMVTSVSDGLMAVGAANIVSGFLNGGSTTAVTGASDLMVGTPQPLYPEMVKRHIGTPAKQMVGNATTALC